MKRLAAIGAALGIILSIPVFARNADQSATTETTKVKIKKNKKKHTTSTETTTKTSTTDHH